MTQQRHRSDSPRSMRDAATRVVQCLQEAGHEALFAGGCVRDMLLGARPHDYDVATGATPERVVALFKRTQQVGAKFGVVLVRIGRHQIEVATFRTDGDYEDGRHPETVQFTNARQDAQRRDFTINGMFYDPVRRQVVDYVGGEADLKARVVRAIGEPARRFAEDHLRILRAIRFAARFDFTIEQKTWSAMCDGTAAIRRISPERIREELEAILAHPNRARAYGDLHAVGVLQHILPAPACTPNASEQTLAVLNALPPKARFGLALAVVLHVLPTREAAQACDALRCSNPIKRSVRWLVDHKDALASPDDLTPADLKLLMARPDFDDLMTLFAARLRASGLSLTPHRRIRERVSSIPPHEVAPPPLFDGHALTELGAVPGPIYKRILDRVYYAQLNGEITDATAARTLAERLLHESEHEQRNRHGPH